MKCESCEKEAGSEDRFCQECGGRLTPTHPVVVAVDAEAELDGKAKLSLDKRAVNLLLRELTGKREDLKLSYENGHFVLDKAGLKLTLTEVPLQNTKLKLDGLTETVRLELTQARFTDEELSVDLGVRLDG